MDCDRLHLNAGSEGGRRAGKVEGHIMIVTVGLLLDGDIRLGVFGILWGHEGLVGKWLLLAKWCWLLAVWGLGNDFYLLGIVIWGDFWVETKGWAFFVTRFLVLHDVSIYSSWVHGEFSSLESNGITNNKLLRCIAVEIFYWVIMLLGLFIFVRRLVCHVLVKCSVYLLLFL